MLSTLSLIAHERLRGAQCGFATEMTGAFTRGGGLDMKAVAEVSDLVDNIK